MSAIDNRAVELSFDNAQFESGVSQSISSLGRLNSAINGAGASSGAMNGLSTAVAAVGNQFSMMEIVAINTLSNIATRAVDTGMRLVKSLSVDQVAAGFEKFGQKTTSVSTLVAQGFELEEVNDQLDRLNWFTDETSYNFVDMVNNIGKFTATGKGLSESVTAMEGIALWAALSGQNASSASRAMYQLAQAMSAGVMKREDYKSIQNLNMNTVEFQQKAIDAAVAIGTLTEVIDKNGETTYKVNKKVTGGAEKTFTATSNFMESLTEGLWFTDEVMMDVYKTYAGAIDQIYEYAEAHDISASDAIKAMESEGIAIDEFAKKAFLAGQQARTWTDVLDSVKDAVSTGWMSTFELVFGKQDEAVELWTDLANALYEVFMSTSYLRNEVLGLWKEKGARALLFGNGETESMGALWLAWDGIGSVVDLVKEAFNNVFNAGRDFDETVQFLADHLIDATQKLKDFCEGLKPTEEESELLGSAFEGVARIIQKVISIFSSIRLAIAPIGGLLSAVVSKVLEFFAALNESDILGDTTQGLDIFTEACQFVGDAISQITELINSIDMTAFVQKMQEVKEQIASFGLSEIHLPFSMSDISISNILSTAITGLSKAFEGLKKILAPVGTAIKWVIDQVKNMSFLDMIGALVKGGLGVALIKFLGKLKNALDLFKSKGKEAGGWKETLTGIVDTVKESFESLTKAVKIGSIVAIAAAILMLAFAIAVFAAVAQMDGAWAGLGLMVASLGVLIGAAAILQLLSPKLILSAAAMLILSIALLVLAGAMAAFAAVAQMDGAWAGLGLMAASLLVLVGVAALLQLMSLKLIVAAVAMLILSTALLVLAGAMAAFAAVSQMSGAWEGLGLMAASLAVVFIFAAAMSAISSGLMAAGAAMVVLGAGMILVGTGALIFAAALILVAAAIVVVVAGVVVLAVGVLILVAALAIVGAIGGLAAIQLAMLGVGVLIAAAGMLIGAALITVAAGLITVALASLAVGLGLLAVPALLVSVAMVNMGDALIMAGDGMTKLVDALDRINPVTLSELAVSFGVFALAMAKINNNKIKDAAGLMDFADGLFVVADNLRSANTALEDIGTDWITTIVTDIDANVGTLQSSGSGLGNDFIAGFVSALNDGSASVYSAAFSVGQQAVAGLAAGQDSHSPSKETAKLGGFFGEGYIIGINACSSKITDAAETMGTSAVDSLKNAISSVGDVMTADLDLSPVITPVVDMSNISESAGTINSIFGNNSTNMARSVVTDVFGNENNQNGSASGGGITYNQYNYSPKALSRVEIYRQTRNLISVGRR